VKISLISCSKKKKNFRCKASEMYSESDLFKKTLSYSKRNFYDIIFIISAKHGLLSLDELIDPYEVSLMEMGKTEKKEWGLMVAKSLQSTVDVDSSCIDVFAGRVYVEPLRLSGLEFNDVLFGKQIGQRLSFLK
jgi:hypothetical protein